MPLVGQAGTQHQLERDEPGKQLDWDQSVAL